VTKAEFVVVGGGVVGCATAWELAQQGREVVLLEAETVAAGASGGPGLRGVRANGRDVRELPLARRGQELWPDLAARLGAETGFVRTGHLELTERADHAELEAIVERQRGAGIATEWLDADQVREYEPGLAPAVVGAAWCPDDGVADHSATTRAYAGAFERWGGTVRLGTRVVEVRPDTVVTDAGEAIAWTAGLVLATNAGTADLVAPLGVALPVFNVFPQVVVTEPVSPAPVHHLIGHAERRLALKMSPDGGVMITGGWLGQDGTVVADQVDGNVAEAVAVLPSLAGVALAETDASRAESICADMVPVVDRIPGVQRAWAATGWSGHGWAIAPAVAEALATWMVTGDPPPDLAPFGFDRFSPTRG
jgi:sarcosine oxidase subunit beta